MTICLAGYAAAIGDFMQRQEEGSIMCQVLQAGIFVGAPVTSFREVKRVV